MVTGHSSCLWLVRAGWEASAEPLRLERFFCLHSFSVRLSWSRWVVKMPRALPWVAVMCDGGEHGGFRHGAERQLLISVHVHIVPAFLH